MKTTLGALLVVMLLAAPAHAQSGQPSPYSFRPFAFASLQTFAAHDTFEAVFGSAQGTFWGGGLEIVRSNGIFVDFEISHASRSGERAFVSNGEVFNLGVADQVSITPIDLLAGYRVRLSPSGKVVPYAGVGLTSVGYKETSDFSDPTDDVDERKSGLIVVAGVDLRVARRLSISADAADTHVTGILGKAGVSQQLDEDNAGGLAARFRIIFRY